MDFSWKFKKKKITGCLNFVSVFEGVLLNTSEHIETLSGKIFIRKKNVNEK